MAAEAALAYAGGEGGFWGLRRHDRKVSKGHLLYKVYRNLRRHTPEIIKKWAMIVDDPTIR